jgi:Cu2+-exporting ATPase
VLSPAVGAVLMSLSTVIVALNAQLLRRVRPGQAMPGRAGPAQSFGGRSAYART